MHQWISLIPWQMTDTSPKISSFIIIIIIIIIFFDEIFISDMHKWVRLIRGQMIDKSFEDLYLLCILTA